jgi:hypothetical protein
LCVQTYVDDAGAGSGLDKDGKVTDDAFGDGRASKLTFLIYLNGSSDCAGRNADDDVEFSGGHTTFFRSGDGLNGGDGRVVEARAVAPAAGEWELGLRWGGVCDV